MATILRALLPERAGDAAARIPSFSCISTSLSTIVAGLALLDLDGLDAVGSQIRCAVHAYSGL